MTINIGKIVGIGVGAALMTAVAGGCAIGGSDADFADWLDGVRRDALAEGIRPQTLDRALAGIEPVRRVVERDRNQAEFKLTYEIYRNRVVTPKVVNRGRQLMTEHRDLLRVVADRYGVQPRFILAFWAIETRYGAVKGTMPVMPAVATLAYDKRRSTFFRKELMSALKIIDRGHIELENLKGSWAGAMGQPQFIPSSYLAYAQDFDGDGRRDIWSNVGDVFASVANYLAKHGWHDDQTWGREVRIPDGFEQKLPDMARSGRSGCRAIDRMTVAKGLADWQALGVRRADGNDLPTRNLPASLVLPDGPEGRKYLVYRNYHSILRYNCAHLYGLTVGVLSDRIGARTRDTN